MLTCDAYLTPRTLEEAFAAMDAHAGRFRLVAGATDILPWAREGRAGDVAIPVLIDLTRIPELKERVVGPDTVRIGAATPIQRFLDDPALAAALPVTPRCAVWFADDQIRESATLGGNLVNASPAADATPALLVHDAAVELASRRRGRIERRTVALRDFVLGPGKTVIADDEIVVAVTCAARPGYEAAFEKVGHRRSLVISTVCLAALVRLDASRRVLADVRLAMAGIGPVPLRLTEAETLLRGQPLDGARVARAAETAPRFVQSRTRREYRRDVVRGFVVRGVFAAARRAGADARLTAPELEAAYV